MNVKLLCQVRHDGKEYSKGDIVEMSKEQAERLVSLGVAAIETSPVTTPPVVDSKITENTITLADGEIKDPRNPDNMSVDELKQELSLINVPFKPNDNKKKLLELYLQERKGNNK
jgi:hypothetical protein